jgi:hypothetical protein
MNLAISVEETEADSEAEWDDDLVDSCGSESSRKGRRRLHFKKSPLIIR